MYNRLWFLVLTTTIIAVGILAGPSFGQVPTGTPPFGSFDGGPDVVNEANLNVHLTIPVFHKAGRGLPFFLDLAYDSSVWKPTSIFGTPNWTLVPDFGWSAQSQIANALNGYISVNVTSHMVTCANGKQELSNTYQYAYHDPLATSHPFPGGSIISCLGSQSLTATTTDGSGYTITNILGTPHSGTTLTRGGQTILAQVYTQQSSPTSATDLNGNQVTTDATGHFTDTLGQVAMTVSGAAPNPISFTYTAPSGAAASFTMTFVTYTVRTNFACANISEYGPNSVALVDKITLPDATFYQFTYEGTPGFTGDVTGRIASIKVPTGGTISYTYTGANNGITCSDGSTAGLKRFTPDTGSAFWKYDRSGAITTITSPVGDQTLVNFSGIYERQRQIYSGTSTSGTLLTTQTTCHNTTTTNCPNAFVSPPIVKRSVTTQIGSTGLQSLQVYSYDPTHGMMTEEDDYDYASGTPTILLRKTVIAYAPLGNNIFDKPQTITIYDGSSNIKSQKTFNYDETAVSAPTNTPTPQHISITGSRGNPTTAKILVQGATTLDKTTSYFDTGNVKTSTDMNGATTTYNYSSLASTCGNAFPDSVNEPLALSKSFTWNCVGGVQLTVTDENLHQSSTIYTDTKYWRPSSMADLSGAVTSFTYSVNPTTVESKMTFNSGNSAADLLTTMDNLGRSILKQVRQSPGSSSFDTIETDFDSLGRPSRITLPFAGSQSQKSSTASSKSISYDALDRAVQVSDSGGAQVSYGYSQTKNDLLITFGPAPTGENTKRRQLEYDALGRMTSVCELTSLTGSGTCNQSSPQTGYWTKYGYDAAGRLSSVTQNAQGTGNTQSRSYSYDLAGRLTAEVNPESGTTTYLYDTDATCGASKGDLIRRTDSMGNVICSSFDLLHRPLAVTYPSGPYASPISPIKHFVYDGATVNGSVMLNTKARLAEAYTCTGACTAKITDEGFSYSARGESTDFYQFSPNSGGYYHATLLYWPNGAIEQISGLPTLPTFTYGLDGEGRLTTVSASSGQNPLTSTSYNSADLPTALTFGSGDGDTYNYDPNTNRMTQYQLAANGISLTGVLGWNANGTLQTQNTTDGFSSIDTQNCTYRYDDMARISSANCGSAASQTFGYDAFGNLSKSGSPFSFQPTYNIQTNRMTSIGSVTPSYDSNGNLLSDGSHTYAWDAEGKYVTLNGVSLTYDALGRAIELGYPSEIVYLPNGSQVLFKGQVARQGVFKLPGGAQAIYDSASGGLTSYHHSDHLGSIRLASTPARTFAWSQAFAPFGDPYAQSTVVGSVFTGQGQTFTLDLYEFPARDYGIVGRWSSPDPSGFNAVAIADPQTLNRYAYVRNTPLGLVDPLGLSTDPTAKDRFKRADLICSGVLGTGKCFSSGEVGAGGCNASVDGISQPCYTVPTDASVQCPNNTCSGFTKDGEFAQFVAGAGGATGYIRFSDIVQGMYEANGAFYSDSQWQKYLAQTYPTQIASQYNRLQQGLPAGGKAAFDPANPDVIGGHANFSYTCDDWAACGPGRYPDGVHVECASGGDCQPGSALVVHDDTASPWIGPNFSFSSVFTGNFWVHAFVDYIGGKIGVYVFSH
jgi:RHS repeat-associated protein